VWLGTSVEHMGVAKRVDAVRGVSQAAVRFISAQPLLGPLDALDFTGIDWVIGGGESGAGARPCAPEWAMGCAILLAGREQPFSGSSGADARRRRADDCSTAVSGTNTQSDCEPARTRCWVAAVTCSSFASNDQR
jgi:hypothetical protein